MDATTFLKVQNLLRLPGSGGASLIHDASVLSCGCLTSESQFLNESHDVCPNCHELRVRLLKPVVPLRELYQLIVASTPTPDVSRQRALVKSPLEEDGSGIPYKKSLKSEIEHKPRTPDLDFLGLFCKFAKEERAEEARTSEVAIKFDHAKSGHRKTRAGADSATLRSLDKLSPASPHDAVEQVLDDSLKTHRTPLSNGIDEVAERNFSRCFPFHRKVSSFSTPQGKFTFGSRSLIKKINRFTGSAIRNYFDEDLKCEVTLYVSITDKKWELFRYAGSKPEILACGRSTGEYGTNISSLQFPSNPGTIIYNDFADTKSYFSKKVDRNDVLQRLKSSDQLYCSLSDKFLVISSTKGIVRVLNVDRSTGDIGQPVYTYIIDFPIRCIALSPDSELLACGITTKEKMTGKQQPFITLHHIGVAKKKPAAGSLTPILITVPYRDPLKIMNFNSSSTHLLCCTIYEMRYFIISLFGDDGVSYKRPKLIFSATALLRRNGRGYESTDGIDNLLESEDDDQMLDNEGITDIKFGSRFSNTIVITSSSLKHKPSVVMKINGPSLDFRKSPRVLAQENSYHETGHSPDFFTSEDESVTSADTVLKLNEIGSNIYGVEVSPRGDSLLFVDKQGRLLLVATKKGHENLDNTKHEGLAVVLLGEVSPSLRYTESASACFSSDGGKIMVIDRKGLFQVFDFTKGSPGEDPEVIKCKIVSLR